jgi:hypothetical protein
VTIVDRPTIDRSTIDRRDEVRQWPEINRIRSADLGHTRQLLEVLMRLPVLVLALSTWITAGGCKSEPGALDPDARGDAGASDDPDDILIADYSLSWGPVTVQPSEESTQCVWLRLSNETEIKVHQMHNLLSASSHHLIVYKDDMDQTEQRTPVPCQPFSGALNLSGKVFPMMITQKHDDKLTLPNAVAYTLAPHQMIKIEMHYLNPNDAAIEAKATATFSAADPAAIRHEANILFIGTPDISLEPNKMTEVHKFFNPGKAQLDLSTSRFFAITGHTHQLGLDVEVGIAEQPTSAVTPVYAPDRFLWNEPETTTHQPEFMVDIAGGFDFTCRYFNNTTKTVTFGESASDEMCFFWAYYYPSNGAHVCAHAKVPRTELEVDLCCPGAGPALCSLLGG